MQRIILIIIILGAASVPSFSEIPVDFYLQSEYKKDSIDYDENERFFYREKVSVLFSKESSLNAACIYIEKENVSRYTWTLVLMDISPRFSFILGNYYINFGYGLLAGQKRIYQPDIFLYKTENRKERLFIPCNSGNPIYAFNGITASYTESMKNIKGSLNLFYSIKDRFIDIESYDYGFVSSTLSALDAKDDCQYNHSEPVNIHTKGGALSLQVLSPFYIQLFGLHTDIQSRFNTISWDTYNAGTGDQGISGLLGAGLSAAYSDDFLHIFCEGSVTSKDIEGADGYSDEARGSALLYGIKFRPPFLKLALTGKEMQSGYYSPYSSAIGEDYPEDAWFFDTEVSPYKNLSAGSSLSSQRKIAPGSSDDSMPVTERQKIYIDYRFFFIENLNISAGRVELSNDEGREIRYQLKGKTALAVSDILGIDLASAYQNSNAYNPSFMYGCGTSIMLIDLFKISLHYIKGRVSKGNPVYSVMSPVRHSNTPGIFIREDSDILISKLDFKYKMIFLSCRYLHQFNGDKSIHQRLELLASGQF